MYHIIAGQFAMSHGSYDLNMGSEILILGWDIRSRSWPNIGDSYGIYWFLAKELFWNQAACFEKGKCSLVSMYVQFKFAEAAFSIEKNSKKEFGIFCSGKLHSRNGACGKTYIALMQYSSSRANRKNWGIDPIRI